MNSVEFQGVSKSYAIYDTPEDRLKELLTLNRWKRHRDFWALENIGFEVRRGETFCIIGENGSGKSTLLQIVAGILQPTAGTVTVGGRVAALLELGAGFNPEFTGHDNVFLNASLLGLTTRQIEQRYPEIVEFADIGDFINQPVKTYSSGMVVRLAFAVAIHVDPEILLVDEALAVGDFGFRQRCLRKVYEFRARGVTILFVSHSTTDVRAIGDRVLWLERGRTAALGDAEQVLAAYQAAMTRKDSSYQLRHARAAEREDGAPPAEAPQVVESIPNVDRRQGNGRAEVMGIAVVSEHGQPIHTLQPGSRIVVRISVRAREEIRRPVVGYLVRNQLGLDFSGTNTAREGYHLPPLERGGVLTVDFATDLPELSPASFSFSPWISDDTLQGPVICDWVDNALALQVERTEHEVYGYLHLPSRVAVNARMRSAPAEAETLAEPPHA